eukprot:TRINITY_DN2000_c0_g1_i2.p2 TRINITY_DN2000_c0_g1~~TRINITY_DN2000_c0_g1_i2.p2  ORF type:complete len:248 (-),score=47.36 TRINITY_DN2000_c0_g1_i2:55-798(-)
MQTFVIMMLFILTLLFTTIDAQDSIFIKVSAEGSSENVVKVGQAVAEAIAVIDKAACKGGAQLAARSEAIKVVTAAAKATAKGSITAISTGNAFGTASTKVVASSLATAIAEAIAQAVADVEKGPSVKAKTDAIKAASINLEAEISQLVVVAGDAVAFANAISQAEGFVSVVAEALATASAGCVNGQGTVGVAVEAEVLKSPSPSSFRTTFVDAFVDASFGGFANILENEAFARAWGSGNTTTPSLS